MRTLTQCILIKRGQHCEGNVFVPVPWPSSIGIKQLLFLQPFLPFHMPNMFWPKISNKHTIICNYLPLCNFLLQLLLWVLQLQMRMQFGVKDDYFQAELKPIDPNLDNPPSSNKHGLILMGHRLNNIILYNIWSIC